MRVAVVHAARRPRIMVTMIPQHRPASAAPSAESAEPAEPAESIVSAASTCSAAPGVVPGKYARVERERRFLFAAPPGAGHGPVHRITDRYLLGTRMRLRRVEPLSARAAAPGAGNDRPGLSAPQLKLTQKIPADSPGPVQGLLTNTYLSAAEYEVFAVLPARVLRKSRHSVPPLGIDVFEPPLHGLVLAEAEFADDAEMHAFEVPRGAVAEVTCDPRFTGGSLAAAGRGELLAWLAEYGVTPETAGNGNS